MILGGAREQRGTLGYKMCWERKRYRYEWVLGQDTTSKRKSISFHDQAQCRNYLSNYQYKLIIERIASELKRRVATATPRFGRNKMSVSFLAQECAQIK